MAFWDKGNKFPYTNNHDANLDYMMSIFENIKDEWHDLYVDLVSWKGTTTLELNTWKTNALAQIEQYETDFRAEIAVWKANTEQDIGVWEQGVLADLGTWRANFETLFATTFSNLTQIKTDAEAARDAAALSATAAAGSATEAAASATSVSSALTQIQTNTGDISDLKTQLNEYITITHGANYLDVSKSVDGYLNSDGTIHPNAQDTDWKTTDFIEVESGATYNGSSINSVSGNFNTLGSYFWLNYNASKEIVGSQISSNSYPYTIPENVKYIRFCYHENGYVDRMLAKSETRPTYVPYEIIRLLNDSPYITNEDKITYEQIEDCEIVGHGANYFDVSKSVDGYLNSNGTIHDNTSSTDWKTSDFIEVEEGITLYGSGVGATSGTLLDLGCFFWLNFDTDKNIVGSQINTITFPYTIPNGVKYIRFSYHENGYVDRMLAESTTRPTYVPYEVLYTFKHTNFLTTKDGAKKSDVVLNRYKNLRWAVFGDSLTEKNIRATTSYYDYVKDELGCSIVNYGVSGTGYARGNSNFMTRMLNVNPNTFDILTIFGSFNDAGAGLEIGNPTDTTAETLCGCINITIDNFYSVAPYKVIGLVTPCPWATVTPSSTWGNNYADAIIAIAKLRGIPYMDLFRESGIRPWAGEAYLTQYYNENGEQDNGAHPNSLGHKVFLYPHFRQFVKELF